MRAFRSEPHINRKSDIRTAIRNQKSRYIELDFFFLTDAIHKTVSLKTPFSLSPFRPLSHLTPAPTPRQCDWNNWKTRSFQTKNDSKYEFSCRAIRVKAKTNSIWIKRLIMITLSSAQPKRSRSLNWFISAFRMTFFFA